MSAQSKPFVTQLSPEKGKELHQKLKERDFEISVPPYTIFAAKKKGISCTLYESGKLVVQGKESSQFIEFFLEPEVLETFHSGYQELLIDTTARIGIDESGKGDFFGPLCIAGVYAQGNEIKELLTLGVRDSKTFNDEQILKLAPKIRQKFVHDIIRIGPLKYNELYKKFANLNTLLGWGHATAIENLVGRTGCHKAIIDQFASERVVIQALAKKKVSIDLTQRHKGEEDPIVAAASILAREAFLLGLEKLSQHFEVKLPKGASNQVIKAGKEFISKHGQNSLHSVAKLHFKTLDAINGEAQNPV